MPESGIPARVSTEGVFTWDWAPESPVTYSFHAGPGFGKLTKELKPQKEPHVVTLIRKPKVSGTVVDSDGNRIKSFEVIPCASYRDGSLSERKRDAVRGKDGQFSLIFPTDAKSVCYRINADGFQQFQSRFYTMDTLPEEFHVKLKKGKRSSVRFVDQNRQPVGGIYMVALTRDETFSGASFRSQYQLRSDRKPCSDIHGVCRLSISDQDRAFIAMGENGYSQGVIPAGTLPEEITVKKWAKLKVRFDKVLNKRDRSYAIFYKANWYLNGNSYQFFQLERPVVQEDGWVEFPRIPPIAGAIEEVQYGDDYYRRKSLAVKPNPGQSMEIDLQDRCRVKGVIRFQGSGAEKISYKGTHYRIWKAQPSSTMQDNALDHIRQLGLRVKTPIETYEDLENKPASAHVARVFKLSFDRSEGRLLPGGRFKDSFLTPGTYWIQIKAYQSDHFSVSQNIARSNYLKKIELKKGMNDLGEIVVDLFPEPKVGSKVLDFPFLDRKTKKKVSLRRVHQEGKFLLLDFWHAWGTESSKVEESLQGLAEDVSGSGSVQILSLEGSGTGPVVRKVSPTGKLDWFNGKLILETESVIRRRLGTWSMQHFILIDPNGNFVAGGDLMSMKKKMKQLKILSQKLP